MASVPTFKEEIVPTIVWTKIDEAPALASYSLLPIVRGFLDGSGIDVVTSDISLTGRILAQFLSLIHI